MQLHHIMISPKLVLQYPRKSKSTKLCPLGIVQNIQNPWTWIIPKFKKFKKKNWNIFQILNQHLMILMEEFLSFGGLADHPS